MSAENSFETGLMYYLLDSDIKKKTDLNEKCQKNITDFVLKCV